MEELKVTFTDKVSIVTKPVPLINKVTDADMNELKNKHNDTVDVLTTVDGRLTTAEGDITAVDGRLTTAEGDITALDTSKQNNLGITDETTHLLTPVPIRKGAGDEPDELASLGEVETEIATTVPTISEQFTVSGGQAFFATEFDTSTASNITFTRPRRYAGAFTEGEEKRVTKPSYSPVITISKENAKQRCKVELYHSGILVPSFLVPTKPSSPLATYADQAAMTADFAAQTEGSYYYFTGSTSAWLFDGTQTDSIDNYEELEEITGWEEWGTKPEWLTVIGDAYLVGADHMNLIKFTYYEFDKLGSDLYVDEVICEVVSIPDGNMDVNKSDVNLLLWHDYNENDDPVLEDSIINKSVYGDFLPTQIINPANAVYVPTESALRLGHTSIFTSSGSYRKMTLNENSIRLFQPIEFSLITKVYFELFPSQSSGDRMIFGNYISTSDRRGFRILYRESNNSIRADFGINGTSSIALDSNPTTLENMYDNGYWTIGVRVKITYNAGPNNYSYSVFFYLMSPDNSFGWTQYGNERTTTNSVVPTLSDSLIYNYEVPSNITTSFRPKKSADFRFYNKALSAAEFESIMTAMNPL